MLHRLHMAKRKRARQEEEEKEEEEEEEENVMEDHMRKHVGAARDKIREMSEVEAKKLIVEGFETLSQAFKRTDGTLKAFPTFAQVTTMFTISSFADFTHLHTQIIRLNS